MHLDSGEMVELSASISDGSQDVLEVCQHIKLKCAELHHYFAELFKEDRDSLLLWKRTAMEEENNAKEFALIAKLRRQNVIQSLRVDLVDAEITLIYLQTLLDRIKEHPPSPEEALRTSIKLEEKLWSFHLNNIVEFTDPSFQKLFTVVVKAEQDRITIFRKAYDQLVGA
jgi:rubrerythrin